MKMSRTNGKRSFSLVASLAGAVILLMACAPAAGPAPTSPAAAPTPQAAAPSTPKAAAPQATVPAKAAEPKRGGRLVEMNAANPASLDAAQEISMNTYIITSPAYQRLVQFDPLTGDKIVADMAESWTVSPDGKAYTFKIRQGVKFHNGDVMTADDVLFSLQRIVDPPAGVNSKAKALLNPALESLKKTDDRTVELRLKFPLAPTLAALSVDSSVIYQKKEVEKKGDMKDRVMGTGPFKLTSFTPAVGAELVRFNDYFVPGRPYLDRITVPIVADESTRVAALRTGRAHMTARGFTISPEQMRSVKATVPNMQFYPTQSPLGPTFFMNIRKPPFSDVRVRKAVSLVIDRDAAVKVVAEGEGQIGTILLMKGWGVPVDEIRKWPGFRPKNTPEGQKDIEDAKKLMAEAGFPNGFDLELLSRTNRITRTGGVFVAGELQKLGIKTEVKVVEDGIFFDRGRKGDHQAMTFTPAYSTPDPGWVIANYLSPGGSLNFSGNDKDEKIIEFNKAQLSAVDESARKKIIAAAEEYVLREQIVQVPMVWPYTFIAVAPQVRGFVLGVSDYAHNGNIFQQMWLDQ